MGLLKTACVILLPAFAWTPGLLPCQPETQALTVATTNDTATLASMLNCWDGSFAPEWFGDVVNSPTIDSTEGTSLNTIEASTAATVYGNSWSLRLLFDVSYSWHGTDSGYAKDLRPPPAVVLHIPPNGVSSGFSPVDITVKQPWSHRGLRVPLLRFYAFYQVNLFIFLRVAVSLRPCGECNPIF